MQFLKNKANYYNMSELNPSYKKVPAHVHAVQSRSTPYKKSTPVVSAILTKCMACIKTNSCNASVIPVM
jgi:hypothetical protein